MIVSSSKRNLQWIKTLWMMYILFPFRIKGIERVQNIIYYGISILLFGIYIYILSKRRIEKVYFRDAFFYLFIFTILVLLAYFVPIVKNTKDFSYLQLYEYYLGRIVIVTGSCVLVKSLREYIDLLMYAVNTYVLFSVALLIPRLHYFYQGILSLDNSQLTRMQELYSQAYYTRFGLQGYSGFGCTIMCSLVVMMCCYLIVERLSKKKTIKKYITHLLIALIGTLMYGRIGFLISIILVIFTVVYLTIIYGKFYILVSFLALSVAAIVIFIVNEKKLEQISSIYWMFEGFFNYLDTGQFITKSTDQLSTMYVHPSMQTFLYGDGYYTVLGSYYMQTDVGYLRPLLFWGIFGEILYYSQLVPLIHSMYRRLKEHNGIFFIILCILFIVPYELKGEVVMTFAVTLYSLLGMILIEQEKNF